MNVRYRVELSQAERDQLNARLSGGKHAARELSGMEEALLVATACSAPPATGAGHSSCRGAAPDWQASTLP